MTIDYFLPHLAQGRGKVIKSVCVVVEGGGGVIEHQNLVGWGKLYQKWGERANWNFNDRGRTRPKRLFIFLVREEKCEGNDTLPPPLLLNVGGGSHGPCAYTSVNTVAFAGRCNNTYHRYHL